MSVILFDLAGTTIDCGCRAPLGVFLEVFRRRGILLDEATARGPMGTHKREHIRRLCAVPSVLSDWTRLFGMPPSEADVDALYAEAEPLQMEVLPHHAEPIPGFVPLLSRLRAAGFRVGATTGYTRPMVEILEPLLVAQGWAPDALVCASDVPAGRPAPYMNWAAATALGAPSAATTVVVGDTAVDMQAARNAGMLAVGVTLTGNEVGLDWQALWALSEGDRSALRVRAQARLLSAGAQVLVDTVLDLPTVLTGF